MTASHTSRSMLQLDSTCPVPWKSAQTSGEAQQGRCGEEGPGNDEQWLHMRYHETLWLGEEHSPLLAFLQHLRRFERRRCRAGDGPTAICDALAQLLRSRQRIRKRFASVARATDTASGSVDAVLQVLSGDGIEACGEEGVMQMALASGPGTLVSAEIRSSRDRGTGSGRMAKLWVKAMESRE